MAQHAAFISIDGSHILSCTTALELTHNWGSETDDSFEVHNGNSEPKGYGHIGLSGGYLMRFFITTASPS